MTAVFLTSSGTEIGKTFVATHCIRLLRERGIPVTAIKPVASGFDEDSPQDTDTALLLQALGRAVDKTGIEAVTPWRFSAPLSPDMAAKREGRRIDFDAVVDFCSAGAGDGLSLVEGIGGVMVPLDERRTVLDLIVALQTPAVLVVGSYLGSISHSLTAAAALLDRNVQIAGIVVNESPDAPVSTVETIETLRGFLPEQRFVALPRGRQGESDDALFGLLEKYID